MNTISTIASTLRPAFRRLAAVGAAAVLVAGSLLSPPPAAAASAYTVQVTFDSVQFYNVDDGCAGAWCVGTDYTMEVYGTVAAYTSAGGVSAGGLPYRNFGKWGQNPSGCPSDGTWWKGNYNPTCPKEVAWSGIIGSWTSKFDHDFNYLLLCKGSTKDTCSTAYSQHNNTILLQVHPGETFTVSVAMQDYDWGSANDNVCVGKRVFGPYTDAQLKSYAYPRSTTIDMADNGHAQCTVHFRLN